MAYIKEHILEFFILVLSIVIVSMVLFIDWQDAQIEKLDAKNDYLKAQIKEHNEEINILRQETERLRGSYEYDIAKTEYAEAIECLSKTVYGEARGSNLTERAAVIWCVLNRVDSKGGSTEEDIINVITATGQFHGYNSGYEITLENYELSIDVVERWLKEKNGEEFVGRVLPSDYLWFHGDGEHNHFRNKFVNGEVWDWSWKSPYEEEI